MWQGGKVETSNNSFPTPHKDEWTRYFEALQRGELSAEEWQSFCQRSARPVRGLPPLEGAERQAMQEEFERLRLACQLFLVQAPDFETLAARQTAFGPDYCLLKMLAASAINLLDLPAPSLPPVDAAGEFEVTVGRTTFTVFSNNAQL